MATKTKARTLSPAKKAAAEAKKKAALEVWERAKTWNGEAELEELLAGIQKSFGEGFSPSPKSVSMVAMQLQEQDLYGLPYVHTRTYKAWQAVGRQVRKGEVAKIFSITWIPSKNEEGEESGHMWPKITKLHHVSQTDPIEGWEGASFEDSASEQAPRAEQATPQGETAGLVIPEPTQGSSGIVVKENKAKEGVEISFSQSPSQAVLEQLQGSDFKYSRRLKLWYARATEENVSFAQSLAA